MKNILLYICALLLSINTVYAGDTLTISAPPSIWVQERDDRLTGPIIDLLEKIFKEFDVKVTSISLPWARAITHMRSGKLDMMPVIFYTEERAHFMDFSISYAEVPTSIFVPHGKTFSFTSLGDLVGKTGLMVQGDSISPEFKAYEPELNLFKIAQYKQILRMLAAHRADYAVAAQYGFIVEAKKMEYETKIEMLPNPIASRSLHFAFSKKSPYVKYLPEINERLQRLKADGSIENMVKKTLNQAAKR